MVQLRSSVSEYRARTTRVRARPARRRTHRRGHRTVSEGQNCVLNSWEQSEAPSSTQPISIAGACRIPGGRGKLGAEFRGLLRLLQGLVIGHQIFARRTNKTGGRAGLLDLQNSSACTNGLMLSRVGCEG